MQLRTTTLRGTLQIDHRLGVIHFHDEKTGETVLTAKVTPPIPPVVTDPDKADFSISKRLVLESQTLGVEVV